MSEPERIKDHLEANLKQAAHYELMDDPIAHVYFQHALEWERILIAWTQPDHCTPRI